MSKRLEQGTRTPEVTSAGAMSTGGRGLGALLLVASALPAAAQIALQTQVVAGGGGHSSSGQGCFVLDATMGQGVAGSASGGPFAVATGYWAGIDAGSRDSLFYSGFEGCQ